MPSTQSLTLRGVRVHNLKNIDVTIPLNRLTVVTGVCGAGKSSLVFDTLYAEAQRRYLQSFSAYTRQFLERFEQPDADEIGDLPPAIAIRGTARGTVAQLAEVAEPVRVLFARAGTIVCPACVRPVVAHRTVDVVNAIAAMPGGARGAIAFPVTVAQPGEQAEQWAALLEEGYVRIQVAGADHRLDAAPLATFPPGLQAWVVLDRFEKDKSPGERLTESVDAAFRRGAGRIGILTDTQEYVFDPRHVCAGCGRIFSAPTPRLLDFNDPLGACLACRGTGVTGKEACPECQGRRWNDDALAVRVGGRCIAEWYALPLVNLLEVVRTLQIPESARVVASQLQSRLEALAALDLGYLTLSQAAAPLSSGATRRIALAAALQSNLVNVLYLIDEPTVDLHPRDFEKLIAALNALRDRGNTVVVVDHAVLAAADHVVDLGPGAGEEGGQVIYQGAPAGLSTAPESPTSDFCTGRAVIETPTQRRQPTGWLKLSGAATAEFPLGVLCAVTGVSGAGKRPLVVETLYPALCQAKKKQDAGRATPAKVVGAAQIVDVVLLDQAPIARSSRSNPATYLKIFDDIRALFAETVDARIRNFGPGHFSFNQAGGRCETCAGQGTLSIDMQFLADVTITCPECQGRRYRKEILDIKVRSRSIAEVLDLTVREAFRFFRAQPAIEKKLKGLLDVGLEYLRLGQALDTLAGGECQRLKLAGHLAARKKGGCLFLLLEPSAGLHPADVADLLACFERLLSAGHSLIVIDSALDVIRSADYLLDLAGGQIVAHGTPEAVSKIGASITGQILKSFSPAT